MPMTGRLIPLTLAAGCRRTGLWNATGLVRQLDLADRPREPLVRGDLPPDRDQCDQQQDPWRVVDRLPLERVLAVARLATRPARRRERQRETDHADRDPDDGRGIDPLVL